MIETRAGARIASTASPAARRLVNTATHARPLDLTPARLVREVNLPRTRPRSFGGFQGDQEDDRAGLPRDGNSPLPLEARSACKRASCAAERWKTSGRFGRSSFSGDYRLRPAPCGDFRLILVRDLRGMKRSRRSLCQIHMLICKSFTGATGLEPATSGVTGRRSRRANRPPSTPSLPLRWSTGWSRAVTALSSDSPRRPGIFCGPWSKRGRDPRFGRLRPDAHVHADTASRPQEERDLRGNRLRGCSD